MFTAINGDRPNVPNVLILISDGYEDVPDIPTGSAATIQAAAGLKANGVTIYTIGIDAGPNNGELNQIASSPSSTYSSVLTGFNSANVTATANSLLQLLCQNVPPQTTG